MPTIPITHQQYKATMGKGKMIKHRSVNHNKGCYIIFNNKSQDKPLIPIDPKLEHTLRELREIDDNLNSPNTYKVGLLFIHLLLSMFLC